MSDTTIMPGTRVRMSDELKRVLRGRCGEAGAHIGPFDDVDSDCFACSSAHVDEFGECVGIVQGKMFPDVDDAPEVNVIWTPSGLCYGYDPAMLAVVAVLCPSHEGPSAEKIASNDALSSATDGHP